MKCGEKSEELAIWSRRIENYTAISHLIISFGEWTDKWNQPEGIETKKEKKKWKQNEIV